MDNIIKQAKEKFPQYSGKVGGRFKDLSGQKIGHLLLLYRGENDTSVTRPRAKYVCLCDCGNIVSVRGENIQQHSKDGHSVSCGKCKEFQFSQLTELQNFYILNTYLEEKDANLPHCTIKCKECGGIFTPRRSELYNDYNKTCAKCNKTDRLQSGNIIGELTLIKKQVDKNNSIKWLCKCSCGEEMLIPATELQCRRSCGKHYDAEDLVGQTFGKLQVKNSTNIFRGHQRIYLCDCECGTKNYEVARGNLLSGHTSSCGCLNSKGEEKISKILIDNNIIFQKQKTFPDFYRVNSCGKMKFDFFVKNSYAIEFDGIQHFKHHKFTGWFTKDNLKEIHKRDLYKNQYCFKHNIPLIRIPYWELDNITIKDLLPQSSKFLFTKEKEQEYYAN